jgi:hypothetical protein
MPILGAISASITNGLVTGSFESIATNTLSSGSTTVTFSSIPSTYKHLQVRIYAKKTTGSGIADFIASFNGDTGANYTRSWTFTFDGAGPYTSRGLNNTGFSMGYLPSETGVANLYGSYLLDIVDYANTNKFKTVQYLNGAEKTAGGNSVVLHGTTSWLSTSAINSITFTCSDSIVSGSSFALYGVRG